MSRRFKLFVMVSFMNWFSKESESKCVVLKSLRRAVIETLEREIIESMVWKMLIRMDKYDFMNYFSVKK